MTIQNQFHDYFQLIVSLLSGTSEINRYELIEEPEAKEYSGYQVKFNQQKIIFRTAKITPTKIGQFVTVWKRNGKGITEPYHENDSVDYYVIFTKKEKELGCFIFSKAVLIKQGIISTDKKDGKRGFRVYPSWDTASNTQAIKTQKWQHDFFIDFSNDKKLEQKFKTLLL